MSVAIATYERGEPLVATVAALLALRPPPDELILVDQTPHHPAPVESRLRDWERAGLVRWRRRPSPGIPAAMNEALQCAVGAAVLFLDDDVEPHGELLRRHAACHDERGRLVAGRVVQPWDDPADWRAWPDTSAPPRPDPGGFERVIGCNMSVDRRLALAAGGFDENFVGTAYRFEAEFARRFAARGGGLLFAPGAVVRHLRAPRGGTRSAPSPVWRTRYRQALGEYYAALAGRRWGSLAARLARRPLTAIGEEHRRRRALDLATALPAELAGLARALGLWLRGPRLVAPRDEPRH